jgi:hypothetical protein
MLTNILNILEESDLDSDLDYDLDNDKQKISHIDQACMIDDTDYIKKYIKSTKFSKRKKNLFITNLFDKSCNYKSFNIIEYLVHVYDKKKISKYIVNNIHFYFSETNDDILKFFIQYDLNFDKDQSIFSSSDIITIFTNLCELGMNELVKLMYSEYQLIKNTLNKQYLKYINQTILFGKFDILEYLCEIIDDHNLNVFKDNLIVINVHDANSQLFLITYLRSSSLDDLDNIVYGIYDQLTKKNIFEKFNFLIVILLNVLNQNLLHDKYKIILNKYLNKLFSVENNLSIDLQIIAKKIFFGFNIDNIKINVEKIRSIIKLFTWMIDLINNYYNIDITAYIIYYLESNKSLIFDSEKSNIFIEEFIQKYNKNEQKYIILFTHYLDYINVDLDLIEIIYKNISKPLEIHIILECFEILYKKCCTNISYLINRKKLHLLLDWLLKKTDLDIIIYYFSNNVIMSNNKIIELKHIDMFFKMFGKTNKIEEFKKITNLITDRYRHSIDSTGIIYFEIIEKLIQSEIKQVNWNKSCIYRCRICLDGNPNIITNCFHQFCKECIFYWYNEKKICPYCDETILNWTDLNIIDDV